MSAILPLSGEKPTSGERAKMTLGTTQTVHDIRTKIAILIPRFGSEQ